jgi:hypothetical protein
MQTTLNPRELIKLHKESITHWKEGEVRLIHQGIYQLVEENHAFNYQLWEAEDKARRDDLGAEFVYQAKRAIDTFNQQRNNRMEAIDAWLFEQLSPAAPNDCPVNSESPGMIIDRLSILSLKEYHMDLQTKRLEVTEEHRTSCRKKLFIIHDQLEQLTRCLEQLLDETQNKKRTFRIYHQFKMYNDPNLNPQLYHHQASHDQ